MIVRTVLGESEQPRPREATVPDYGLATARIGRNVSRHQTPQCTVSYSGVSRFEPRHGPLNFNSHFDLQTKYPWLWAASELNRPSDSRLSVKLVSTFED
jgi:hypothetical protein